MPPLATLSIGALSKRSGVDIGTIEEFQRQGLISRPRRANGVPLYPLEEVDHVILINSAQQLGFSKLNIRRLLRVARTHGRCEDIFVIAERHLTDIRRRRADLERIERRLAPLVETCPRSGPVDRCNIIAALCIRAEVAQESRQSSCRKRTTHAAYRSKRR